METLNKSIKVFRLYLIIAFCAAVVSIAYWYLLRPHQKQSLDEVIEQAEKNSDTAPVFWYAKRELKKDSSNPDLLFAYYFYQDDAYESANKSRRRIIERDVEKRYQNSLQQFKKNPSNDLAALQCLLHNLCIREDGKSINYILKKNPLDDIKYGNYLRALLQYEYEFEEYRDTTSLNTLLQREELLPQGGYKKGVAWLRYSDDTSSIREKLKNPLYLQYIDEHTLIGDLWYGTDSFWSFNSAYYPYYFRQHPTALLIALAGALLWIFFFYRIDVFEREKFTNTLVAFSFGVLSVLLVDAKNYFWENFSNLDTWLADSEHFTDRVFGQLYFVGLFEEGAKMAMFLLLLLVKKKWVNESFDYILYPALIAIGFAFVENIGYIYRYNSESLGYGITRTMLCTLGHICFSVVWGWGIYLVTKREPLTEKAFIFIACFFMAALLHAVYNASVSSAVGTYKILLSGLEYFIIAIILEYILLHSIIKSRFYTEGRLNYDRAFRIIRTGFIVLLAICFAHYLYYYFYAIYSLSNLLLSAGSVLLLVFVIDNTLLMVISKERIVEKRKLSSF